MSIHSADQSRFVKLDSVQQRRLIMWIALSAFAALLGWFGFRGYLNPELLFQFANSLYC